MNKTEPKSMNGWSEYVKTTGKSSICSYLNVGDYVTQDIFWHFLNIMPPTTQYYDYLQVGEAYGDALDYNNRLRPTFLTFVKSDELWIYKGNCFKHEIIHRD